MAALVFTLAPCDRVQAIVLLRVLDLVELVLELVRVVVELLHALARGFKQSQEFFFVQNTELAIATADA